MARRLLVCGIHGLQRVSQRAVALDVICEFPCLFPTITCPRTNPRARAPAHHTTGTTSGPIASGAHIRTAHYVRRAAAEPPWDFRPDRATHPAARRRLSSTGLPNFDLVLRYCARFETCFEIGCCSFAWSIPAESRLYPTPPPRIDPSDPSEPGFILAGMPTRWL